MRDRIFELLKEISESKEHSGLLVVYSDITNVLGRGAHPLGKKWKDFKELTEVGNINDENAAETLKKVGEDGAVLIDERGYIFSPAVYLNVNIFSVDENLIEAEFCARHIAALATSSSTDSSVYTISEETGKVREFIGGKVRKKYPSGEQEKILEAIQADLEKVKVEDA